MNSSLLFLFAFFSLSFFQVGFFFEPESPNSSEKLTYGKEYFPLKNNLKFIYDSNIGTTEAEIKTEGKSFTLNINAGSLTYKQTLMSNEKGIYMTRVCSKAYFFGKTITYSKPLLRLPLPITLGSTWQWIGYEIDDGDSTRLVVNGSIIGIESINTKVGKFDCIKVVLKMTSGNETSYETEWLAPEIGIVKSEAKISGSGISGLIQKLMGLSEIKFLLARIKD
ncbi:MAG: hypothetical protein C4539_00840 [Ignavibacteriales bacterium]|nr:MAG: hypothetical protein C4539_00840 [Ignavibacteriales bacterium]